MRSTKQRVHPTHAAQTAHPSRIAILCVVVAIQALIGASFMTSAGAAAKYSLGTYTVTSQTGSKCPSGFSCQGFTVSCPGVQQSVSGYLAIRSASGPKGLVMFFTGKGGSTWETQEGSYAPGFMSDMHSKKYSLVLVRWKTPWLNAASGERAGPARLACRPSTVIRHVHDHIYVPKLHGKGLCGFCIMGDSGGASEVSYGLAFFGLDSIVDTAIPVSGPPHAALLKGCSGDDPGYTWPTHTANTLDASYGFLASNGTGPCATHNPAYDSRWSADGVDTGGTDYYYPKTRVIFLFGTKDGTGAPRHAQDYANRLQAAGSYNVHVNWVDGMTHTPLETSQGASALRAAIIGSAVPNVVAAPPSQTRRGGGRRSGGGSPGGVTTSPAPTIESPTIVPGATGTRSPRALAPFRSAPAFPWVVAIGSVVTVPAYSFLLWRRRRARAHP